MSITKIIYDPDEGGGGGNKKETAEEKAKRESYEKFYEYVEEQENKITDLKLAQMSLIGDQRDLLFRL